MLPRLFAFGDTVNLRNEKRRLHGSIARCKGATLTLDTDLVGRRGAFNPAESLVAAQSACIVTPLELLALCTALSTDTVIARDADHPGDALAVAVGLDMADWWTPTAASYLDHIPKARIIEDLADATSADKAAPLAKLKKGEAVATAESMLAGSRWLPAPLRPRAV